MVLNFLQPCFDIDECTNDPCVALATCVNLPGTFECPCNSGYEGDGEVECTDIDECALDYCDTNASCINTIGSVECFCNAGYAGNGTYCENVNECEQDSACQEFATCFDNIGSFYCTCDAGYRLHTAQVGAADEDVVDLCVEIVDCEVKLYKSPYKRLIGKIFRRKIEETITLGPRILSDKHGKL